MASKAATDWTSPFSVAMATSSLRRTCALARARGCSAVSYAVEMAGEGSERSERWA